MFFIFLFRSIIIVCTKILETYYECKWEVYMKIEKLNEDKIRITLDSNDLKERNIDFHSFMSNSISTQSIFVDMLKKAEKEVGFITKNYKTMIEAFATSNGSFILTITRIRPEIAEKDLLRKKKMKIKRKTMDYNHQLFLFCFQSFDDYCEYCSSLKNSYFLEKKPIAKTCMLYRYQNLYYLVLKDIQLSQEALANFFAYTTEFAEFIHMPNLVHTKLLEYGTIIMKKNALKNGLKYFGS